MGTDWSRLNSTASTAYSMCTEAASTCITSAIHGTRYLARTRHAAQPEKARALRDFLLAMGPMYIKAGQIFGTQGGLFDGSALAEFREFFSDLPAMPAAALGNVLERAYPAGLPFETFDPHPIAVGSVAQVHRATLKGGAELAVKVVKEGVRDRLVASRQIAAGALRAAHATSTRVAQRELPKHFSELGPLLTAQCDMLAESRNQHAIRDNFRGYAHLVIPEPLDDLCTEDVLVMDFMRGVRAQDFDQAASDRRTLARRLQDVFYMMVFLHGRVHLDPHPGNMFFDPEGRIVLLDFGLVTTLSETERWELAAFYYSCLRQDWERAIECFVRAFVADGQELTREWSGFAKELTAVLRRHFQETTLNWSTMAFCNEAHQILARYRARMTTKFSALGLAFLTGEGFISLLDPSIDIWRNARRFSDRFSPYMSHEIRHRFQTYFAEHAPKSAEQRQRALSSLIAPTHLDRYVLPSAFPIIVKQAKGCRLVDVDCNEYIDLSCGYGPHFLGYAHPVIVEAVAAALAAGGVNALASPAELTHARLIASAFGERSRVIFANSGTEAVLMAIRMSRAHTGRQRIAKFEGHYHGFSDQGMVSSWFRFDGSPETPKPMSGAPGSQASVVDETLVLQYGDPRSLERIRQYGQQLAAVILEPMPSVSASYDRAFLSELRKVCTACGIVLVFDEVVTGFRVCFGGAQHLVGVTPDLTCLGKIIGGGLPCGAVVGDIGLVDIARTSGDPFFDLDRKTFVGGTMSGNSITCAAGAAALQHLADNPEIYSVTDRHTRDLVEGCKRVASQRGIQCAVSGQHSILSLSFDVSRTKTARQKLTGSNFKASVALSYYMRKRNVYVPELHTLMLSAAHTGSDIEAIVQAFDGSLDEMTADHLFIS